MQIQHVQASTASPFFKQTSDKVQRETGMLEQYLPGCALALEHACCEAAEVVPFRVRAAINEALTPDRTQRLEDALLALPRNPQRYTRHVLYADPLGRFTVIGLVWDAQQLSPIHAHFTWCAYQVLGGTLSETHFSWDAINACAVPVQTIERGAGQSVCGHAGLELIHQLGNAGEPGSAPAVSLHVYGIDEQRSASHVNRILAGR